LPTPCLAPVPPGAAPATAAAAPPAAWTDVALAQAGLLLLLDCDFDRAFAALDRATPSAFQPAQLFPLFPEHAGRWAAAAPRRAYWGLHGHRGLPPLRAVVDDWLELRAATGPRSGSGSGSDGGGGDALVAWGTAAAAAYLERARERPGVALPGAVDTLLVKLLADAGDGAALEALVARPHAAEAAEAGAALRAAGRWHAAALLAAALGHKEEALDVWQVRAGGGGFAMLGQMLTPGATALGLGARSQPAPHAASHILPPNARSR
jgi:hypothetical protein